MAERSARTTGEELAWRSTVAGAVLWATFALALRPSLPETSWRELELFFAVLVLVPIGLVLCVPATPTSTRAWHVACGVQPLAATVLILAWADRGGATGILAALPWFTLTSFCGFLGLSRLRRRGLQPVGETCVDAALITVAIGGLWVLFARRSDLPLGWSYPDVLAEAAYFHGVGFMLLLASGLASPRSSTTFVSCAQFSVLLISVAVLALRVDALLGENRILSVSRVWADMLTMLACLACAGLQLRSALRLQTSRNARLLWILSSLHLVACGALGLYRAVGLELQGLTTQSFVLESSYILPGFALAAALAWKLARLPRPGSVEEA